jgi:hypothetical protein
VKIINPIYDLLKEAASLRLRHSAFRYYVVEELSTTGILHDQVELSFGLDYVVELDNIRMPYHLEDRDLTRDSLNIVHVGDSIFLKNLDCYLLSSQDVLPKFYFSKCSLAQCITKLVVSYVRGLGAF